MIMVWMFCRAVSALFALFPYFIIRFIWRLLDVFDGRGGALMRYVVIASRLGGCGNKVYFGPQVFIDDPSCVHLGSNVSIHQGVCFLSKGGVFIGSNVSIAHGVSIVTGNHTWGDLDKPIKYNPVDLNAVRLGDDVWVGCGVRILAGVSVGGRSIIAAGAVVHRDVEGHSIYGGVPARRIKAI